MAAAQAKAADEPNCRQHLSGILRSPWSWAFRALDLIKVRTGSSGIGVLPEYRSLAPGPELEMGMRTWKRVSPGTEVTLTLAADGLMMRLTARQGRDRCPRQPPLVVKKGSKMRDLTSGGMPGPLSAISTRMKSFFANGDAESLLCCCRSWRQRRCRSSWSRP